MISPDFLTGKNIGPSKFPRNSSQRSIAAQQARLYRVPIHILDDVSDTEAAEIVAAAFAGYSSNPIDEAEFFVSRVSMNARGRCDHKAVTKLAYRTGHSRPYISHSLRLLKLPIEIQELVRENRLSAGHARALVSIRSRSTQRVLAKRAAAEKLTGREIEQLAKQSRGAGTVDASAGKAAQRSGPINPDLLRLQTRIGEQLGCAVSIDIDAVCLAIQYQNLDVLDGVFAKLGISTD